MVSATNDIQTFFEKEDGEIIIYGCGHYGGIIGDFMERCGIQFKMYIDKKWGGKGLYRGGSTHK